MDDVIYNQEVLQSAVNAFYDLIDAHGVYDLEIDTSQLSAYACAKYIKIALDDYHPRTAMRRLMAHFVAGYEQQMTLGVAGGAV